MVDDGIAERWWYEVGRWMSSSRDFAFEMVLKVVPDKGASATWSVIWFPCGGVR